MKTILITGINGFLGSHLAKALKSEYKIIGLEYSLDNLYRLEGENFRIYSSSEGIERIFIENSLFAIIHAATIYRRENEPLEKLINTNIILPVKLFEFANNYNCKMFLNIDSFFNNPDYNYSYLPDYTLSKKQVLEWLKLIKCECKLINMKIFHMYGPDDNINKFIPKMIRLLKNRVSSIDLTQGSQKRDFIYIDDVISAFKTILKNYTKLNNSFSDIDIGTGKAHSIREFMLLCRDYFNPETTLNFGALPQRKNEIEYSCADINFLKSLGWKPKFSLLGGIKNL